MFNAHTLTLEVQQQGDAGKATVVRACVPPRRAARRARATGRFETAPGAPAQVDRAPSGTIAHRGRAQRRDAFALTLGWSRARSVECTTAMARVWFLRCHRHAVHYFGYFGGVPRVLLHANRKTAARDRAPDGAPHRQPPHRDCADDDGFPPRACRPDRAQPKGKIAHGINDRRGHFWAGLRFTDLADPHRRAREWAETVAKVRRHGSTGEPRCTRLPCEGLAALVDKPDRDTRLVSYRWSGADCPVSSAGNAYRVPAAAARPRLLVRETAHDARRIGGAAGAELARQQRAAGYHARSVIPAHHDDRAALRPPRTRKRGARRVLPPLPAPLLRRAGPTSTSSTACWRPRARPAPPATLP